jgi:hypothetical protein
MIARVYQAINGVAAAMALDGVAKTRLNARDNYVYRSIDDVLERLAPLLAQHRLCILPRVLEREAGDRHDDAGNLLVAVALRVAFDVVSAEDGSSHTIEAYGEALDGGDKATAKAMQSAYKYAVLQAFCVPAAQTEDADAKSYRLKPAPVAAEPTEGWIRWAEDLQQKVQVCTTYEELQREQEVQRANLDSVRRERPDLYAILGQTIGKRKAQLKQASEGSIATKNNNRQRQPSPAPRRKRTVRANGSGAHA